VSNISSSAKAKVQDGDCGEGGDVEFKGSLRRVKTSRRDKGTEHEEVCFSLKIIFRERETRKSERLYQTSGEPKKHKTERSCAVEKKKKRDKGSHSERSDWKEDASSPNQMMGGLFSRDRTPGNH